MSIKDWPVNERPREKLLAQGAHCLSDAELLAVLVGGSGRRAELFHGTSDGASVHPREVVKQALAGNAAAMILAHNHPLCCFPGVTGGLGLTIGARIGLGGGRSK